MALSLCVGVAAQTGQQKTEIVSLLPAADDVKGWQPLEGSLQYGAGSAMSTIYDGAAPELQRRGVVEAAQQLYQTKDKKLLMEITLNRLNSEKEARAFFESQRRKLQGDKRVKLGRGEMFLVRKKPVQGYVRVRNYVASAVPTYGEARAPKDTAAFLKAVEKKLAKAK